MPLRMTAKPPARDRAEYTDVAVEPFDRSIDHRGLRGFSSRRVGWIVMRVVALRALAAASTVGLVAFPTTANGAASKNCGSVGYTVPHTHDEGHAALNNLRAVDVSCPSARKVALTFLSSGKAPARWRARPKTITTTRKGEVTTVGEEVFTDGLARITGDIAN